MLADFGLSRIMEEEKLNMLTEICGTPGVSVIKNIVLSIVDCFYAFCCFVVYGTRNFQKKLVAAPFVLTSHLFYLNRWTW